MRGLRPLQKNNALPTLSIMHAKWIKPNFMGKNGAILGPATLDMRGFHAVMVKMTLSSKKNTPRQGVLWYDILARPPWRIKKSAITPRIMRIQGGFASRAFPFFCNWVAKARERRLVTKYSIILPFPSNCRYVPHHYAGTGAVSAQPY